MERQRKTKRNEEDINLIVLTISVSPVHGGFTPFSPSLISLMVSVDVKHRAYILFALSVSERKGIAAITAPHGSVKTP